MEQIFIDILEKWAEYVNYDEEQTCFNLLNYDYETNKRTKQLTHIINDYDESGILAILTIKRLFEAIIKDSKISLLDAMDHPEEIKKHLEMREYLNCPEIKEAEDVFIDKIKQLALKVISKDLIGKFDDENFTNKVFLHVDNVIQTIDKCKIEFYQQGGEFTEITNFSTNIHVFPSLAECLITLSNAPDGMYLCYIDIMQTSDSYFGFFIKNNGNLLSINDRIDEAYKGQHSTLNRRNGRWASKKADLIFPYEFVVNFDNYDHTGYSHTYNINKDNLDMFKMEEDTFLPILIAMVLLVKKLSTINKKQYEPVYLDSLLEINKPLLDVNKNNLMVIENSSIVQHHKNINLDFDYDKVIDGSIADEFNGTGDEHLSTENRGQLFVDLYGKDFKIQPTLLSTQKLIGNSDYNYIPEFVGSEKKLRLGAYVEIRKQLADYIYQQMYEEYERFGGIAAVKAWYEALVNENLEKFRQMAIEHYVKYRKGEARKYSGNWQPASKEENYYIAIDDNMFCANYRINQYNYDKQAYLDLDNEKPCYIFFRFIPRNYKGIEQLFNIEVPKIVKGWNKDGNNISTNNLLNAFDAVEGINVPFESSCSNRPEYADKNAYYDFSFAFGFSKSGLKKYCKSLGIDLNALPPEKSEDDD